MRWSRAGGFLFGEGLKMVSVLSRVFLCGLKANQKGHPCHCLGCPILGSTQMSHNQNPVDEVIPTIGGCSCLFASLHGFEYTI